LEGEAFDIDAIPRDEIIHYLTTVYEALNSSNLQRTLDIVAVKNREQATAFYLPLEQRAKDSQAFFEKLFAMPQWTILEPDYTSILIRPQAENRLLRVTDKMGKPVLKTPVLDDDFIFGLPTWFAKVDGQWILCR
jgi:hypothetical protein